MKYSDAADDWWTRYKPSLGLAALADSYPDKILERLLKDFQHGPSLLSSNKERSVETRLKVGEVLMRTSRAMGEHHQIQLNSCCVVMLWCYFVVVASVSCLSVLCALVCWIRIWTHCCDNIAFFSDELYRLYINSSYFCIYKKENRSKDKNSKTEHKWKNTMCL